MKTLIAIILTAIFSLVLGIYFPWWSIAIAAFGISLAVSQNSLAAFSSGFLGVFIAWGLYSFLIDRANESILSTRIADLLPLGGNPGFLILFTAVLGGLIGGLSALSGNFLIRPGKSRRDSENYYQNKFGPR